MRARWMAWLLVALAAACTTEVKLDPELRAKFDKATALVRSDDKNAFPEAERLLDEVIAGAPKYDDAIYWKAQMLIAWSDALQDEAVLLASAEKRLAGLVERAQAKVDKAETPEAKAFAEVLLSGIRDRHDEMATTLKQWRAAAASNQKRGLELVQNEIAGKGRTSYKAHRILADYHRIKGDGDKARQELEVVRSTNPDSAGLHFVTGVMKLKAGDHDAAVANMEKALARDPEFVKALYYKGLALADKGDVDGAEKVMQAVLKKSSEHLGAKTYLHITDVVEQATADLELEKPPTE